MILFQLSIGRTGLQHTGSIHTVSISSDSYIINRPYQRTEISSPFVNTTPRIRNVSARWRWVAGFTLRPFCPWGSATGTHWI